MNKITDILLNYKEKTKNKPTKKVDLREIAPTLESLQEIGARDLAAYIFCAFYHGQLNVERFKGEITIDLTNYEFDMSELTNTNGKYILNKKY